METSVPLPLVGTAEPAPRSGALAAAPHDPTAAKPSARCKSGELAVVADFPSELPITEAERQLVSVYLGDMIRQILSELRMSTSFAPGARVAVYARVSTIRQAEADLSIPDQIAQAEAWCHLNGAELVRRYVEPGASGTDENRPIFQELLADARSKPRLFDVVFVHSFSRLCRDEYTYAAALRDLTRAGITLHSLTQPLGDDHTGRMVSSILVSFDAYQSRENGKHTARAMKENARQGF